MKRCPICNGEFPDDARFCPNDGGALRADGAADLVGSVIAERYHVLRKLGEGGMGQVYLAEHVKMGRQSAIKVMNASLAADPESVSRFNREAANACRISHPNVCTIYDFGEHEGLIYLAMEFIEGTTLTNVLAEQGALPLARAADIARQVAEALGAAHDVGIVHRDLKPDNIMIVPQRGRDLVKVVDFGIAKAMGAGEGGQKVTKTGLVVGTPEYMSPEQLVGDAVDGRSDLYALALVTFRMLTGEHPYAASSGQEALFKRLTEDPRTLAAVRPDLPFPAGVQPVLDRALRRTPAERQATPAEFARELAAAAADPAGRPAPASEPATRLLDAAGGAPTVPPTRVASAVRPAATAPRRSSARWAVPVGALVLAAAGAGYVLTRGGAPPVERAAAPADTLAGQPAESVGATLPAPDSGRDVAATPPALPAPRPAASTAAPAPAEPTATPLPEPPTTDEFENAATRADARRRAEALYARPDAPAALRVRMAEDLSLDAQAAPVDLERAILWLERAQRLEPSEARRQSLALLRQAQGRP